MKTSFPVGFSYFFGTLTLTFLLIGLIDPTKLSFQFGILFFLLSYEGPRKQFAVIFKRSA